jgi:hypothetical protein
MLNLIFLIYGQGCYRTTTGEIKEDSNGGGYGGIITIEDGSYGTQAMNGDSTVDESDGESSTTTSVANSFIHFSDLAKNNQNSTSLRPIIEWIDALIKTTSGALIYQRQSNNFQTEILATNQVNFVEYNPQYLTLNNQIFSYVGIELSAENIAPGALSIPKVVCRISSQALIGEQVNVIGIDVVIFEKGQIYYAKIFEGSQDLVRGIFIRKSSIEFPVKITMQDSILIEGSSLIIGIPNQYGIISSNMVKIRFVDSLFTSQMSCVNEF